MIRIGTSGFQYPEWKGKFYPETLSAAKMLSYYAAHFSTTESNYTFRQIPKPATFERWSAHTPEHFCFSLKASQRITHFAKLRDCGEMLNHFCTTARALGPKLGPILFQLPPTFKKDLPLLTAFLSELPAGFRGAFEFRHASWFDDAVFSALRERDAALCIARSEELATPRVATASFGYLRLREVEYGAADFLVWAEWLRAQTQWQDAFVYFKHEETGTGPVFAQALGATLAATAT